MLVDQERNLVGQGTGSANRPTGGRRHTRQLQRAHIPLGLSAHLHIAAKVNARWRLRGKRCGRERQQCSPTSEHSPEATRVRRRVRHRTFIPRVALLKKLCHVYD